jgi:SAM-dependent methyltransferase
MTEDRIAPPFLAGVAFVSLATLLFEILLTRIFSVTMWYHFAFLAISIAMFGLTAGGMAVFLLPQVFTPAATRRQATIAAVAFAALIVLGFLAHLWIPFRFEASVAGVGSVTLTYVLMALPFTASGICLTLALTRFPGAVGRLYAADLAGAAAGCLLLHGLLQVLDGPTAVVMAAFAAALGGWLLAWEAEAPRLGLLALLICLATGGFSAINKGRIAEQDPLLKLRYVKGEIEGPALYEKWNSFSRIRVYGDPDWPSPPFGWGFSPFFKPSILLPQLVLNIDATAGTVMTRFNGDLRPLVHLRHDICNVAHALRQPSDVLVIGAGGGRDVLSALVFQQKSVLAVEINEDILHLVNGVFGEFTGHLDRVPGVRFVADEARSYVARTGERFDIIQVSLIDTWAATAAGAFALSENGLYTVEAWQTFLDRLRPGGLLTFSRWYADGKPWEMYRLVALGMAALQRRGATAPRAHLALLKVPSPTQTGSAGDGVCTILVNRDPWSEADRQALTAVASAQGFEVVLAPDFCRSADLAALTDPATFESFVAGHAMDISPSTDDRPFFFNMLRLRDVLEVGRWNDGVVAFLCGLLVVVTGLTLGAIGLPLVLAGPRPGESGWGTPLVFFAAIGFGFMLVEVSLIQKLQILLGHPTYSLVVVLFSLLLAGGAGSWLVRDRPLTRRLAAGRLGVLLVLLTGVAIGWPALLAWAQPGSTGLRIGVALGLLVPLGLCMGAVFPLGMGLAGRRHPGMAPWFWGVNGATSILGSVLAMVLAFGWGISVAFRAGLACYAIALLAAWWMAGPAPTIPGEEAAAGSDTP